MEPMEDANTVERMLIHKAASVKSPANGSIELLPLCNMNCDMCYVHLTHKQLEEAGGRIHTGKEWLEIGKQMVENGTLFLLLTGGEPLLHPDFKEIYLGLKKMGIVITINTNATLIDESWVEFFKQHMPRRINITLYGSSNETYERLCHYKNGYDKVMNSIKMLQEADIPVRVGFSLAKNNQKDAGDVLKMVTDMDIPISFDTYMLPATRERKLPYNQQARLAPEDAALTFAHNLDKIDSIDHVEEYVDKQLKLVEDRVIGEEHEGQMECLAGKCSYTVNWQGEMHPCVILTAPTANVFEVGFKKAWETVSDGCSKIRLYSGCSVCKLRPICRTCAASHLLESGSYMGKPEYMCTYTETLYEEYKRMKKDFEK